MKENELKKKLKQIEDEKKEIEKKLLELKEKNNKLKDISLENYKKYYSDLILNFIKDNVEFYFDLDYFKNLEYLNDLFNLSDEDIKNILLDMDYDSNEFQDIISDLEKYEKLNKIKDKMYVNTKEEKYLEIFVEDRKYKISLRNNYDNYSINIYNICIKKFIRDFNIDINDFIKRNDFNQAIKSLNKMEKEVKNALVKSEKIKKEIEKISKNLLLEFI